MMLRKSIRKLASFIRFANEENETKLQSLKNRLNQDPENMLAWRLYYELDRKTKNNLSVLREHLGEPDLSVKSTVLDLFSSGINHLKWMSGLSLPELEEIDLTSNAIVSLYGLEGLNAPNLEDILLSKNRLTSLNGLAGLSAPKLKRLWLGGNQIETIRDIGGLDAENLKILDLSHNNIRSLEGIEDLIAPELDTLLLNNNNLSTSEELEPLLLLRSRNIDTINLAGNPFSGYMTSFKRVLKSHLPNTTIKWK